MAIWWSKGFPDATMEDVERAYTAETEFMNLDIGRSKMDKAIEILRSAIQSEDGPAPKAFHGRQPCPQCGSPWRWTTMHAEISESGARILKGLRCACGYISED